MASIIKFFPYSEFLPFLTLLLASKNISASVHHFYLNEGIVTVTQNAHQPLWETKYTVSTLCRVFNVAIYICHFNDSRHV